MVGRQAASSACWIPALARPSRMPAASTYRARQDGQPHSAASRSGHRRRPAAGRHAGSTSCFKPRRFAVRRSAPSTRFGEAVVRRPASSPRRFPPRTSFSSYQAKASNARSWREVLIGNARSCAANCANRGAVRRVGFTGRPGGRSSSCVDGQVAGLIGVADTIRSESREAVGLLRALACKSDADGRQPCSPATAGGRRRLASILPSSSPRCCPLRRRLASRSPVSGSGRRDGWRWR